MHLPCFSSAIIAEKKDFSWGGRLADALRISDIAAGSRCDSVTAAEMSPLMLSMQTMGVMGDGRTYDR